MSSDRLSNGTLFTHREGVIYIEHCRLVSSDGMLAFVRSDNAVEKHYSIPHANVCVLLLGPGTSVTHQAARKLAEQGVMLGFVGGGGSPLFIASQSEYRPTEYCQAWVSRWSSLEWRLMATKVLAEERCSFVLSAYKRQKIADASLDPIVDAYRKDIAKAIGHQEMLGYEAAFAKRLYAYNRNRVGLSFFKREPQGDDLINRYVDNGNYLAYGLAASALWVLGIPHSFPVTHGFTRRGALVFDLADVIKDGALLPIAFSSGSSKIKEQEHRGLCLLSLDQSQAMKTLFDVVKKILAVPKT